MTSMLSSLTFSIPLTVAPLPRTTSTLRPNVTELAGGPAHQRALHCLAVAEQTELALPILCERVARIATRESVKDCLRWFSARKDWITQKQLELCRIPAPTFHEHARAQWLAGQLRSLGWNVVVDNAGNVLARSVAPKRRPRLALTAHLDTVLAPARSEDIFMDEDHRLHGPGVADNGAGLAALLAIAAALSESGQLGRVGDLLLVANVGEEGEGNLNGMRFLCTSPVADDIEMFVVLDGPGHEQIVTQGVASRRLEIVFEGPGGHSWSDAGLPNPIHALGHLIARFCQMCEGEHPGTGRRTFNFALIEGGAGVNAIPASARARVDLRAEHLADLDWMAERLRATVREVSYRYRGRRNGSLLRARVRELGFRPPGRLAEESTLLACLLAVDRQLGIRSRLEAASTDANIPLAMGRQAVSIGGGGSGARAHTVEEWYDPAGRELALARILLLILALIEQINEV